MSDIKSATPIRTENNGDAAVKVVDGTLTSQALGVDASGRVTVKLADTAGTGVTSQANGSKQALDVGINVAGVQVDPRAVRALIASDVVTANQGTANTIANAWPVKSTDGVNSQSFTASGEAKVDITQPIPAGTNSIGKVVQDNTTQWVTQDLADGSVTGGTAGTKSMLAGAIYNSSAPTLTTGQQASLQTDVNGNLLVDIKTALPAGTNLLGGTNVYVGGTIASGTNPVPVQITSALVGTSVNNYNTAAAIAVAGTSNHTYTITTGKTFNGKKIHASASGKLKIEVQVSPDGTTYSTLFVAFNSAANPNIDIDMSELVFLESGVGSTIRVIRTNEETLLAQDIYSTISGTEV